MKHFFTLDGKSSADFNTFLASSTMFDAAERDVETVEIPGRNGNIIYDNGRYKNFAASVYCYIPKGMQTYVRALRNWLLGKSGYCRYEDSIHPDEYRLARYTGGFELEEYDRIGATVTLSFDCKPQRFLKSGETAKSYASGAVIYNPTACDALPLIVCTGNGTITLGDVTMTISGNDGEIYIDCDTQNAYLGTENKNGMITADFPKLSPGDNALSYEGVTDVRITPRWWTV